MAVSSNRSPSPVSTRPNPNSRNSETNSSIRRSFSGNPLSRPSLFTNPKNFNSVTPANSPAGDYETADFGRRHEEKENEIEKDPNSKPVKLRSPAILKGTKNFMSPTISAASKITTPSPRKKILTEKNDPVRVSLSYSEGKTPFSSMNFAEDSEGAEPKIETLEMCSNHKNVDASIDQKFPEVDQKEVVLETHSISKALESSPSETITLESNEFSVDKSAKIKPFSSSVSSSPIIAPLDADPSLLPYDPKNNYLSPRPQFLHYRPNPRIEVYHNKEGGRLEESFMSENLSDSEVTGESQSEDSQKESEDVSSAEMESEEEEGEEEKEPHVSESEVTISDSIDTHMTKEIEAKRVPKPRFFSRSMSISLFLVFLIGCLSISVTDSPVIDSSVYRDLSFTKFYDDPSEIAVIAKANIDVFAGKLKDWSANTLSYFYTLIRILDKGEELGPLQFSNLTALQEDFLVDTDITENHKQSEERLKEIYEEAEFEPLSEEEVEIEPLEEKVHPEVEAHGRNGEVSEELNDPELEMEQLQEKGHPEAESDDRNGEALEKHNDQEIEEASLTKQAGEIELDSSEAIQSQETSDSAFQINSQVDQSFVVPEATELEASEFGEFQGDSDITSCPKIESITEEANLERFSEMDSSFVDAQTSRALHASTSLSEDKFPKHQMLGIALLVFVMVASTVFIYLKQRKTKAPSNVGHQEVNPLLTKKMISSSELVYQDRPSSQNLPTEVDVVGESCPSEMSSFQKSSSYSRLRSTNEAQSQERKHKKNSKRESLASSSEYSMGSPSFGSFTTYEKIHAKHGSGDEEMVTPVRRSSRIRSQVTSP